MSFKKILLGNVISCIGIFNIFYDMHVFMLMTILYKFGLRRTLPVRVTVTGR